MDKLRQIWAEHKAALRTPVAWEGMFLGASIALAIAYLMGLYPLR